jgi:hypothetical protein
MVTKVACFLMHSQVKLTKTVLMLNYKRTMENKSDKHVVHANIQ